MIAPGYYWIRWPHAPSASFREWQIGHVHPVDATWGRTGKGQEVHVFGDSDWYDLDGAELGPRIEPPSDKGSGEDVAKLVKERGL
jgi:hypothetical protein